MDISFTSEVSDCNSNTEDCNNWRINKVSIVGKDLDFMSSDCMKEDFDHFSRI